MGLFLSPWDLSLQPGWFHQPAVTEMTVHAAPEFMHGLKALFVSDVHLRSCVSDAKLTALLARIETQSADLLLLGGDYGEGEGQCARFFAALSRLHFPLGIYGVPGNNDDPSALENCMRDAGAQLLLNRSAVIGLPGGKLQLGGCDDHKYGHPQTKGLFSGEAYRILLSHIPAMPDCACELMLSGHTHGGQMNLFGFTPYSIGYEHGMKQLAVSGQHQCCGMQLAVCNGVGVSKLPLRIGARAEILLLKFAP